MKKWLSYITLITLLLGIGYWAGHYKENVFHDTKKTLTTDTQKKQPQLTHSNQAQPEKETVTQVKESTQEIAETQLDPNTPLDYFLRALNSNDYPNAIIMLHNTLDKDHSKGKNWQAYYIKHINFLLNQTPPEHPRISNAIQYYLADFYDDTDILLLQAKQYQYQDNFYDAINTLQLASTYAYTSSQLNNVDSAYQLLMSYIDGYLSKQKAWGKLIDIYLHAEDAGLMNDNDIFRLAELYMAQDNHYQAQRYAEQLSTTPYWQSQAAAVVPKNSKPSIPVKSHNTIPLTKVANHFIVSANISGNPSLLLIDTGASITTLSKAYFDSIIRNGQFSYQKRQEFLTANGKTNGDIYTADELSIGMFTIKNVDIAVIDFPTSEHSVGLLGMNILRDFRFEIDQKNATLLLEQATP